jgi:hypothetical protein
MVLSIIFLEDKHKILLHLLILYEYQQFFQHRICFSIQPQLQLINLHRNSFNRIVHYSIFIDAFVWLLIVNSFWSGFLYVALLLFAIQTLLIKYNINFP